MERSQVILGCGSGGEQSRRSLICSCSSGRHRALRDARATEHCSRTHVACRRTKIPRRGFGNFYHMRYITWQTRVNANNRTNGPADHLHHRYGYLRPPSPTHRSPIQQSHDVRPPETDDAFRGESRRAPGVTPDVLIDRAGHLRRDRRLPGGALADARVLGRLHGPGAQPHERAVQEGHAGHERDPQGCECAPTCQWHCAAAHLVRTARTAPPSPARRPAGASPPSSAAHRRCTRRSTR